MTPRLKHRIHPITLRNARSLRRTMTPPEAKLWSRLRNGQLGRFKFRRQHEIGNFIVDFCCAETTLVIELDGDSHTAQEEYDEMRTRKLNEQGYQVIRFTNRDVLQNLDGVLTKILDMCRLGRPSP